MYMWVTWGLKATALEEIKGKAKEPLPGMMVERRERATSPPGVQGRGGARLREVCAPVVFRAQGSLRYLHTSGA